MGAALISEKILKVHAPMTILPSDSFELFFRYFLGKKVHIFWK
jgi:hypothetical protein